MTNVMTHALDIFYGSPIHFEVRVYLQEDLHGRQERREVAIAKTNVALAPESSWSRVRLG